MTPQLRFPEFTDEWQVKKLGEIVDIVDGDRGVNYPKQTDFTKAGYCLFLNASNVTKSGFDFKEKQFISTEKDKALNKGKLSREDVVLTTRGTVGNFAYYSDEVPYDQVRINSGMVLLRAGSDVAPGYLHSSSSYFDKQIKSIAFGSAQPQLTVGAIKKLKLPMPSKPEQEKIADFLTAVDERIAAGEKKLELLETYKRGVMQKIFSQQIRFKDENGSPYPDWEEKKLESLLVKNKKRNKNLEINYVQSVSNARGFVSQNDYFDGANIASKNTSNYFIIEKSTFAYNPSRINVGSLAYKSDETTSIVSPLYVSFKTQTGLLDGFLLPWFSTELFKKQMNRSFEGSVRDTLSFAALSDMRLMLPNEQEQQKITNFITTLDEKITAEKSKLTAAREFKKALLQRMFV